MKPLRERNQAAVGGVTLVLLVLGVLGAFFSADLPIIGTNSTTYSAYFTESAGLSDGDEVQVAGVGVGEVSDVDIDGDQVIVDFKVRELRLGDQTRASIQIKTLLGEKFLALEPAGANPQDPGEPIPRQRTVTPFDVTSAISQLTTTVGEIDTKRLAEGFQVIADEFSKTPEHMRDALNGLSALSKTISSRDQELVRLLQNTSQLSTVLANRDQEVRKLLEDGNILLAEIQRRKTAISTLLDGTRALAAELRGLVADNQAKLRPALEQLNQVTAMLARNQDNLSRGLAALAPFVRISTNTTGSGRWFDGYLCGLLPPFIDLGGGVQINPDGCQPPIASPPASSGGGR
jgi:phospholipid/cholesterol/gamma-HCH transport system substrate-binding protein